MLDLTQPGVLNLLSERIAHDIDEACVRENNTGPRSHLGASEIGKPCERELWFKFRWCFNKVHSGQQYRLFNRGHFEEPRFKSYLESIGFQVQEFDKFLLYHPESSCLYYGPLDDLRDGYVNNVDGILEFENKAKEHGFWLDKGKRQIRIGGAKGHFGGSTDGIGIHPEYGKFLLEYKTQGLKKFPKLVEKGCIAEKYQHFCQQSIYGYKLELEHSIYMVVCKDNDNLHIEVLKLDWELGKQLEAKAERIIFATESPKQIASSPKHYECNYCDMKDVCWYNKPLDINCRSCKNAIPIENGCWQCEKWNGVIPKDEIGKKQGCWCSIL